MNEVPVSVTSMVEFTLDGEEVKVPEGSTILDACRREGIEIGRASCRERV